MKILNVNMSLDPESGGGTAERSFQVSRALVRAGAECTILTSAIGIDPVRRSDLNRIEVVALPCLVRRFYVPAVTFRRIKLIVGRSDIIELVNHWTVINALVYHAARQLKKPYVVCPAGALPIFGRSRFLKIVYNRLVGRMIIQDATDRIAISTTEISQFQSYGIDNDGVTLIPNGVNPDDFQFKIRTSNHAQLGPGDAPYILFMGRLNRIKGPDLLLKAFLRCHDRLPDFHLVFAGPDDGLLAQLKVTADASTAGGRIHFAGYLGGERKISAYQNADLLVIPSRQEAMSLVVLEAGISGTPVLLTDQCGFDEISRVDGGRVVPASVGGLQKGLDAMLSDPDRRKEMGTNLKKYVESHYTWDQIITKYLNLYNRILS